MKKICQLIFLIALLAFSNSLTAVNQISYSKTVFTESPEDDGTIDNAIVITFSNTSGYSFKGNVGDDFVALGNVSVTNLPDGLTARILKTGNLTLLAVLTGTAIAHNNADDIANLTFTFNNGAFSGITASMVIGSNNSNLSVNFRQIINVGSSGDYTTIAEALAVCGNGDIINLAAETFTEYNLDVGYRYDPYIRAIDDITLQGQGPGKTIVQGASSPGTDSGEIFVIGFGYNVTIKDLTVRYGKDYWGGGILCSSENTKLINLDIYGNTATSIGGAIYVKEQSSVSIENCTIHDNTGDGLSLYIGTAAVTNTTIAKNTRTGSQGGGIYCEMGTLNLLNCTVARNTGDGLYAASGNISIMNTIMAQNTAKDYSVESHVSLTDNGFNVIEQQSQYHISGNWQFTNSNDILFNYKANGDISTQWTKNNTAMVNQTLDLATIFTDNSSINRTPTLAVSPNSFVINAGTDTGAPITDQRGFSRYGTTDIGAYERNGINNLQPTITTASIVTFNSTSATLGGNVTSDGGATVSERGVVYSLSGTPDISDTKVQIGSGTGSFSQAVTGLLRGTTYYVQAYATSPVGTAYGSVQSFTTESGKPVISNLNGDSGTYTEGDAPLALDSGGDATVSNPESNFEGGKLTVYGAFVNNEFKSISPSESLVLSNGMLSGSTITIDGTVIGSIFTGKTGQNGGDLVVSFNVNATDQLIGKLLHHIKYHSVAETSNGTRNIYFTLQNSLGLISDAAIVTITTYVANDAPTLTATALNPTFIEGNSSVALFSDASASTVESSQTFTALTLTISNVTDGSFEQLLLDGSPISLTNGTTGTSSVTSLPYSVSVTGTTATVSITGASLSVAELQTLVNSLKYSNSKSNPTEANRVVTISTLKDNGGTANGGDDTAELAVASSVTVFSGKPVISNLNGDSGTFKEGDSPMIIDIGGNAAVINHSGSGFNGGNLTVSVSSASSTETIAIKTSATIVLSNEMNAGSTVSISGTAIGTVATGKDGKTGHDLVVTLNANATTDLLSTLIQNITYFNDSEIELGSRIVQVSVKNATAFISDISSVSITALAVNDPPTLNITAAYPTFTEHGPAVKVYSGATASTVEPGQVFTGFGFTVTNLLDGAAEQVVIDGTYIALTNGNSGTTATNNLSYSVSVSNSIASVTITGGSLTAASLQAVLNNLSYYNSSNSPSTNMNRLFRIQSLKDDGGTANGGSNTASLFINSSVSVVATSLPTVTTSAVTIFDGTSATLGGDVTADGSTTVTERGVVYSSTVAIPTIGTAGVTKDANGTTGTGAFSKSISNLGNGTLYYVRAYAINAEGTAYGSVQSFTTKTQPTVTTAAISTYDGVSATMGGNVTADGSSSVTERGVVYSGSDTTPVIGETGVTKNINGTTGTGTFSKSITGLSRGTTYYVCAYAINADATAYGSVQTFTTNNVPTVITTAITIYSESSATLGGNVTADAGATVTERGVVYSSIDNTPTIGEADVTQNVNGTGTGAFSKSFTELSQNTTYYVRAYAINSEGTSYGSLQSFTTLNVMTVHNNALDFDGLNDYVNLGDIIEGTIEHTEEAWIKWSGNNSTSSDFQDIILKPTITSTAITKDGSLHANYGNGTTWGAGVSSAIKIPVNVWTHIATVRENSGKVRLYINGVEDVSSAVITLSGSNSEPRCLGVGKYGGTPNIFWFYGEIDEVRIWNNARSASEIHENMMRTLVGNESGLAAYYRFDQTGGTTVYEGTSNKLNGELINMDSSTDWVDSEAFTTWLGGMSTAWSEDLNWSDGVPTSTDNVGIYKGASGSEAALSGSPMVSNIMFSSTASPSLASGFTVNGNLLLQKNLDLNGKTITLGSSATLVEGAYHLYGSGGSITTTRSLSNLSAQNVAGMGAVITTAANMGSTVITRTHASQASVLGGKSVLRNYQITPQNNTGLNATLVYNYHTDELNGITESQLALHKSLDTGSSFTYQGGVVDDTNNSITLTGIGSFGLWTAGLGCINPTNGGTIGSAQTICSSRTPTAFTQSAAPSGTVGGTLQYKWQISVTSAATGFSDITGATETTYHPGTLTQTSWYKRLVKVDCESNWLASNVVQVTVNQPSFVAPAFHVSDLQATGINIKWYAASTGGSALASNAVITNGTTYYASQTVNGVESSSRLAVTVSIDQTPCAPTGAPTQSFSVGSTVANLVASGSDIRWYSSANGGTYLDTSAILIGGIYYATQTVNCTESANRLAVVVIIN